MNKAVFGAQQKQDLSQIMEKEDPRFLIYMALGEPVLST
tara:strand:+ start:932 stop:1048 length:117 start_codon:yes stop_codon:yes gene_type:complete